MARRVEDEDDGRDNFPVASCEEELVVYLLAHWYPHFLAATVIDLLIFLLGGDPEVEPPAWVVGHNLFDNGLVGEHRRVRGRSAQHEIFPYLLRLIRPLHQSHGLQSQPVN